MPRAGVGLAVAVIASLAVAGAASAKTFTVNDRSDHNPGKCNAADCTLREAVIAANKRDGSDRITLPATKPYRLTRGPQDPDARYGDLDVRDRLRIVHVGAGLAKIRSQVEDRVIESTAQLLVDKLVVRDGAVFGPGGGVMAHHDLEVKRSRVVANHALRGGGIAVRDPVEDPADLTVRRSTVASNLASGGPGGGIDFTGANLRVVTSTIARNEATCPSICLVVDPQEGGGLRIDAGGGRIRSSTISGNRAFDNGGGIWNGADAMGIVNTTIADNSTFDSGGGIYAAPDSGADANAVTIARNRADANDQDADNGGGIFADGGSDVINLANSLVVLNRTTGGVLQDCDAPAPVGVTTDGGNLISTSTDCPFFDDPEDLEDSAPMVRQLADNGGPTETAALRAGSPAIGEADGFDPPEVDQRGVARDGNPDAGAYER